MIRYFANAFTLSTHRWLINSKYCDTIGCVGGLNFRGSTTYSPPIGTSSVLSFALNYASLTTALQSLVNSGTITISANECSASRVCYSNTGE